MDKLIKENIQKSVNEQFAAIENQKDFDYQSVYNGLCLFEKSTAERAGLPEPELKDFETWKAGYIRSIENLRRKMQGECSLQEVEQFEKEVIAGVKKIKLD